MTTNFTDKFFSWADQNSLTHEQLAALLHKKIQTMRNWKSAGIPNGQQMLCQSLMENHAQPQTHSTPDTWVSLRFNDEEYTKVEMAAKLTENTVREYCHRAIIAKAREDRDKSIEQYGLPTMGATLKLSLQNVAEEEAPYNVTDPQLEENEHGGESNTRQVNN